VRPQINWVSGKDLNIKKATRQHGQIQKDGKLEKEITEAATPVFLTAQC